MTAFNMAWSLLKGEYEDIPPEDRAKYRKGSLNALPGHKPGCDLRLNGFYPHYSQSKYSGVCTCAKQCANCESKEKWMESQTDLCFDCSLDAVKQGLIEPHPLMQFYLDHEFRRWNA